MTAANQHQLNQDASEATATQMNWVHVINQWKSSGMSQTDYCNANNINYNKFIYQISKLSARNKTQKLLPVKIGRSEFTTPLQNNFVIHYPNGLKLHIPINAHPEAIKSILNCME